MRRHFLNVVFSQIYDTIKKFFYLYTIKKNFYINYVAKFYT